MLPSFSLFGEVIYSYALLLGVAWGIGCIISEKLLGFKKTKFYLFFLGLFCVTWIGAKTFFLFTSSSIDTNQFLRSTNFWLGGGFVYYGGLIFGLLYISIYSKLTGRSFKSFESLVIPLGVSHGIGRIGCFFAGCCHGVIIEFPQVSFHTPTQIFEALSLFGLSFLCWKKHEKGEEIFFFYLKSYAIIRFVLEFFRADEIRGLYFGVSSSQIISLMILLFMFLRKFRSTDNN